MFTNNFKKTTTTTLILILVAVIPTTATSSAVNQNNENKGPTLAIASRDRAVAATVANVVAVELVNIRHERSKQRHSSEKEQHVIRTVFDTTYGGTKAAQPYFDDKVDDGNITAVIKDNQNMSDKAKKSTKFHKIYAVIEAKTIAAADKDTANNVTKHLNNANDLFINSSSSSHNINSVVQATAATQRLTTTSMMPPATTIKAVTHKIRKLHKKKIKESLRQLNNEKFQANGGQLTKNHHRSLLEAEQLQKQAQLSVTTVSPASHNVQQQHKLVAVTNKSRHHGNDDNDDADDNDSNSSYKTTNDYETNESMTDGDLSGMLDEDDDNEDEDAGEEGHLNEEISDVLYQNDIDNDDIFASTINSRLLADKYDSNISLDLFRDINNDLSLAEIMNFQPKDLAQLFKQNSKTLSNKSLKLSQKSLKLRPNISEDFQDNSFTESSYDFLLQSEEYSSKSKPRQSASTSVAGISFNHHKSSNPSEEDINFNESSEDSSFSNDPSLNTAAEILANDAENDSVMESNSIGLDVDAEDEPNRFLEGVVDAANSDEIYDWDEISRSNRRNLMRGRDVVTKFLQIVETQHSLGADCEAGTSLNLGEGVVDRYAQDRFRIEAEVAVNRANMLTRIFKMTSTAAQADINLLHASVLSMVEFDDDIFAAGNCFDWNEHPSQPGLFCPFAYRLPPPNLGAILAKDLSMEYHYLGNTSEWFFQARKNAEKVIARNEQYLKAFHLYSNKTDERIEDDTLAVKYEDGRWSKPYYDCGGGNIWMLTYTVPFFGYENFTYHFKGTSGIDIDLRRVDIDQCPQRNILGSTKPLNIFAGTDKCKQRTTMCEAIQGLGFRRGSYKCVCRKGYYFPDTTSQHKYFNGSLLEEEYEKLMLGTNSTYNIVNEYKCLPCAEGCDFCEDGSPCIAALNWPMRTSILVLACIVIGLLPPAAWFTFRYQQVKVVRAASPALLRVIALGAFFIYCTNIVMYPNPNLYTCTARIWLREIGFSLTYGALMLKTWRISVIFRVRSAKAVKITDAALLKRLGCICGAIGTCLLVRTLVSPPDVVVGRTADDLKAFLCKTDWWDYTFTSMEVVFLAWGVRLCIMVRKAPSEFNESRFISMAIYNEFLLTCFLNVSMLFLQSPANPDLLYIIFFCHTQLTITLLLALIFGSKVYIVLRSGKSHQENIGMGAKSSGAKFNFRPQVRTFANPSSVTTSTVPVAATTSAETKLSDQEALEEIRQLSMQLQRIQEMAPPKGVAVMTISSLLDGLRTPGSMVMVAAAASQAMTGGGGGVGGGLSITLGANQLAVRPPKPEALSLLSLNTELQKYQQLQIPHKMSTTTITANNNVTGIKTIPAITLPSSQVNITTTMPNINNASMSMDIIGIEKCKEKAINTEIVGNCIAEEEYKHKQQQQEQQEQQHIICKRCYERCKDRQHYRQRLYSTSTSSTNSPAKLNKCQILGSPQPEGSISFKNIKLDCMCSQSNDLDQLPEQQHGEMQPTRRIIKRSAATNTPPCATRKRATTSMSASNTAVKASSSVSLPADDSSCRLISSEQINTATATAATNQKPISYLSRQQICDNCKNKFKTKQTAAAAAAANKQHRNLSRLSKKGKKLLAEEVKTKETTATTTTTTLLSTPLKCKTCEEQKPYSTEDLFFYTTTDTSEDDDDDDDDVDNDSDDDDLSSSFSQSKSESKLPFSIETSTATIELKCVSLSLGNITTTSTVSSQPETVVSRNALLNKTSKVEVPIVATTTTAGAAAESSSTASQQQHPQQSHGSNGGNNGKTKRPDKLVLNLNDRSKFTKEVSV